MEYLSVKMIGQALAALRASNDISLSELEKELKVPNGFLFKYESVIGGYNDLDVLIVNMYANYFNVPVSSIIYIAEQLERARQGFLISPPRRDAMKVLQAEMAKAELKKDEEQ